MSLGSSALIFPIYRLGLGWRNQCSIFILQAILGCIIDMVFHHCRVPLHCCFLTVVLCRGEFKAGCLSFSGQTVSEIFTSDTVLKCPILTVSDLLDNYSPPGAVLVGLNMLDFLCLLSKYGKNGHWTHQV